MMVELRAYEESLCSCGFPKSWTRDESNHFTFEDDHCRVCAGADQYARIQHAADEEHKKKLGEDPPADREDPSDGRKSHIRLMSQAEVEQYEREQREKGGG